jgi:hypothetical protein
VKAPAVKRSLGWVAPGPLWSGFGDLSDDANRSRFARPAILRFANDNFMEEMMGALALYPERLGEWVARWESWEKPMKNPAAAAKLPLNEPLSLRDTRLVRGPVLHGRTRVTTAPVAAPAQLLKLYQPVQNRFYLVTASLVCRRAGLPDRHIDAGKQEQVGFVLRRLVQPETNVPANPLDWDEYAFIHSPYGPRWQKVGATAAALIEGEERLPMFSLGFTDAAANARRLFSGLIPVGRREAYLAAPPTADTTSATGTDGSVGSEPEPDTRLHLLALQVTGPWRELVNNMQMQRAKFKEWESHYGDADYKAPEAGEWMAARERAQITSWYALLDLYRFFLTHVPRLGKAIAGENVELTANEGALSAFLEKITIASTYAATLNAASASYATAGVRGNLKLALESLAADSAAQENLESAQEPFSYSNRTGWPSFLFPLADPDPHVGPCPLVADGTVMYGEALKVDDGNYDAVLDAVDDVLEALTNRVADALLDNTDTPRPELKMVPELNKKNMKWLANTDGWFAIRCVYERPNCGPLNPAVLSAPSEPFQMASFFDPEAPARQIRIPMPFNISPAALRRYNKSATLVVSDMLCGQIKRIRKLTLGDLVLSVLPWPFHKDLPKPGPAGSCDGFGTLCSLSIPIVTLCALILMLIIVALFDLFFHWIPLLFLCFRIPGLGKKQP